MPRKPNGPGYWVPGLPSKGSDSICRLPMRVRHDTEHLAAETPRHRHLAGRVIRKRAQKDQMAVHRRAGRNGTAVHQQLLGQDHTLTLVEAAHAIGEKRVVMHRRRRLDNGGRLAPCTGGPSTARMAAYAVAPAARCHASNKTITRVTFRILPAPSSRPNRLGALAQEHGHVPR